VENIIAALLREVFEEVNIKINADCTSKTNKKYLIDGKDTLVRLYLFNVNK